MDVAIVGCQNGDEGKGKFSDVFASGADLVVRYQGGPHTGHTVQFDGKRLKFIQVPVGVARLKPSAVGNGCVIDPIALVGEINGLKELGLVVDLTIAPTCHVVFPYHRLMDEALESWRGPALATDGNSGLGQGAGQLGSTRRGVGPCREDKIARIGLRLIDVLDYATFERRLARLLDLKRRVINAIAPGLARGSEEDWSPGRLARKYHDAVRELEPYLGDVAALMQRCRRGGGSVLFEGAQSLALDVEHGTYPYCSSGFSAASGLSVGCGRPPGLPLKVLGVVKSYTTTVGGGPLPTEIHDSLADRIAERGREYGTVTGRRRRIGWLDLGFVRKAVRLDGIEAICLSCLDVLAGLDTVKVCTHYDAGRRTFLEIPTALSDLAAVAPIYEAFPGWPEIDPHACLRDGLNGLPVEARTFVDFLSRELGTVIAAIGLGSDRTQTLTLTDPFAAGG
jgi:adenylosuccinate synthase